MRSTTDVECPRCRGRGTVRTMHDQQIRCVLCNGRAVVAVEIESDAESTTEEDVQ